MLRRILLALVVPLAILAVGLASAPWLRAFPSATISVALFGAAILSVLVPVVVLAFIGRNLLISSVIDLLALIVFELLVVLHDPTGFDALASGVWHGPAQLLSFALPLVSPRSLLVAPIALCWLAGAIAGEGLARSRSSLVPFAGLLVSFGLSYAATVRAAPSGHGDATLIEVALAAGLLFAMALLRLTQTWLTQQRSAEDSQADSALPLRSVGVGVIIALVITGAVGVSVRSSAFGGHSATAQRLPKVDQSAPLTPIAFISSIRTQPDAPGKSVFQVTLDHPAPAYFGIASVDFYDGDSWSFNRVFRPSGGVVPADLDATLDAGQQKVTQHYHVQSGPLVASPWMPTLDRVSRVSGTAISVDEASAMVVPTSNLNAGENYTIDSSAGMRVLSGLGSTALPATSAPPIDTQLPATLRTTLTKVITALSDETGVSSSPALPFLQAVAKDLQTNYELAGTPATASVSVSASPSVTPGASTAAPSTSSGTSFAEVLASILGGQRTASPEQYATLFALLARNLGVPARVVTGFRVTSGSGAVSKAGRYDITTAQAASWVEIPVQGQGWIVADPSPTTYANGSQSQSVGAAPSSTPTATPSQRALITNNAGGHAVAKPSATRVHHSSHHSFAVLWSILAILVLVLLLGLVFLALRKVRRRARRRRSGDPRARLIGAWNESIDMLIESGLSELRTSTNHEIAEAAGEQFGASTYEATRRLGDAANAATYSSVAVLTRPDADQAWSEHLELRRLVRGELSFVDRVLATLRFHRTRPVHFGPSPASWSEVDRNDGKHRRRRGH